MDTLVNFRDLGGHIGANGARVRQCRLLRSAQPVGLSDADKRALVESHHLARIVDFRGEDEAQSQPVDNIDGVSYTLVDILAGRKDSTATREGMIKDASVLSVEKHMCTLYAHIASDSAACSGYTEFVNILLSAKDGATLFHCFAGKDRTGVAAAIVLHILGVSDVAIFADYMLSNEMRREANEREFQSALAAGVPQDKIDAMKTAMNVKTEYLQEFMNGAKAAYGDLDAFIIKALGVTPAMQEALKHLYLE